MRTIVIAPTVAEGRKRFPSAVAVLTPKARAGARGKVAERVVALRGIQGHPALPALRQEAAPALVTADLLAESGRAAALPAGVRLEGAEDGRSDDEEREEAPQKGAERAGGDPEHESSGNSVHESDVTE